MRALLAAGLVLFGISLPPNLLALREITIASSVERRYRVEQTASGRPSAELRTEARVGNAHVVLQDDAPASSNPDDRFMGPVRIVVNGRNVGVDAPVTIRPSFTDANRYWGFVYLTKLTDDDLRRTALVVSQNLGGFTYRVLWIDDHGNIAEDRFVYADRCSPPVRAMLIRQVTPHPSGYCSDVMTSYPSLFYPMLYPWISGGAGAICAVWAGVALWRRSNLSP